jgi:hypothetical protein
MKKIISVFIVLAGVVLMLADTGSAIPAFARKYGFNCNMCHTAFTKLNDFGQRFRQDGYQIPGQEGYEKNVFATSIPLAMRTSMGLVVGGNDSTTTSSFNINGLDILAAGVLHKNISFLLIYTPRLDEPAGDYTGADDGANPSQLGALESANLVFSNLVPDLLNVRVGRFEPAYHPISSKRTYYLISPYEIYTYGTDRNSFVYDDNQMGIEVTGNSRVGFHYAAGVVNGNGANPDNNKAKDLYLTMHQVIGRGEGQSAGQRIGVFGYYGWQPTILDSLTGPMGENEGGGNKKFYRFGGDVSFNYRTLNLRALFMQGVDDKALNPLDSADDYEFNGGIVELDWAGLYNNRLVASAMVNWVNPPCGDESKKVLAYSGVVRYNLGDWTAVNIALHAEYLHREVGKDNPFKDDIVALMLDFAF